jgi:hypothetical protein
MSIDFGKLIDINYWFEGVVGTTSSIPVVESNSVYFQYFIYSFITMASIGTAFKIAQYFLPIAHPFAKKFPIWSTQFIWISILGMLWFTLRQTKVSLFGARFWTSIGIIWLIVLVAQIVKYFIQNYSIEYSYYKKSLQTNKNTNT